MSTLDASPDFKPLLGKVAVVTGATDGIGRITAERLVGLGADLWVVGRNEQKCERVVQEIREHGGRDDRTVGFLVADLSSQVSVRELAKEVQSRVPRLDILVNNAGAMFLKREETPEGFEKTFALNHLGYFTLTNLLIPQLRAAGDARIVSVASDAHRGARSLNFDDLQARKRYSGWGAYCQSKLANVLFTRELARRLEGSGVTANCLHPGFVRTAFFGWGGMPGLVTGAFARIAAITPEAGARTSVYLASAAEVSGLSGRYFNKCRAVEPSPAACDDEAARRLWDVSEKLTDVGFPD